MMSAEDRITEVHDVAIVGAGPAGAAAAILLANTGYSVVVIDRYLFPVHVVGEALPPSVSVSLRKLGVFERFLAAGHCQSLGNRSVWGDTRPIERHFFHSDPYGCGWHVARSRFNAMLLEAAASAGAGTLRGWRLDAARRDADCWRLVLARNNGRIGLRARFAIDASGRSRAFARKVGARNRSHDRLVGLVGYFRSHYDQAPPAEGFTQIEAVDNGWWYSAPLPDGSQVAGLLTDSDLMPRGVEARTAAWRESLRSACSIALRLRSTDAHTVPAIVPATSSISEPVGGHQWLAVGDAAAAYDPLAGQGVDAALRSGMKGAEAAAAALNGNHSPVELYVEMQHRSFAVYLKQRRRVYASEQRWPASAFWMRRQREPA